MKTLAMITVALMAALPAHAANDRAMKSLRYWEATHNAQHVATHTYRGTAPLYFNPYQLNGGRTPAAKRQAEQQKRRDAHDAYAASLVRSLTNGG